MVCRKTDRRTLYTLRVIKDAYLKLINQEALRRVTVTKVCQEAEITRSTFYLHYDNLDEVLNDVLDEALLFSDNKVSLDENDSLIPACQRIAGAKKYRKILMNPDLTEYIVNRIAVHERQHIVPQIIDKTGLDEHDAEILFQYMIHGSFAINQRHHFIKDQEWYREVTMLNSFVNAGYQAFSKGNR